MTYFYLHVVVTLLQRKGTLRKDTSIPILAIVLLKQMSPRNWNSSRSAIVGEGKNQSLLPEGEGTDSGKEISSRYDSLSGHFAGRPEQE